MCQWWRRHCLVACLTSIMTFHITRIHSITFLILCGCSFTIIQTVADRGASRTPFERTSAGELPGFPLGFFERLGGTATRKSFASNLVANMRALLQHHLPAAVRTALPQGPTPGAGPTRIQKRGDLESLCYQWYGMAFWFLCLSIPSQALWLDVSTLLEHSIHFVVCQKE